jgi:hypothetical protein
MDPAGKAKRLQIVFTSFINGKRAIRNVNDAKIFFEAVRDQREQTTCVEKIVAASHGLKAVKMSLCTDTSSSFINEHSAHFLIYIADDDITQLCNGQLYQEILDVIVEPPTFWNALEKHFNERKLSTTSIQAFASLLHGLVTTPKAAKAGTQAGFIDIAENALASGGLLISSDPVVRSIAYKLKDAVRTVKFTGNVKAGFKPGGRHDNDFENYREIAIFPTADEFAAKDTPYYLQADAVMQVEPDKRVATHLDNQFRLLREDMVGELRNDLQLATSRKSGRRAPLRLSGLEFHAVNCGERKWRKAATIAIYCLKGLPEMAGMSRDQRRQDLKGYAGLKHNSFGCLLAGGQVISFATVERNDDLLANDPPIVLLQISGKAAILRSLVALKSHPRDTLEFLLVDTPFFAYEPVLRCLQEKSVLPLATEILTLDETGRHSRSPFAPTNIITTIQTQEGQNLSAILGTKRKTILDGSQTQSLVDGLSRKVSLIQGPPGK